VQKYERLYDLSCRVTLQIPDSSESGNDDTKPGFYLT